MLQANVWLPLQEVAEKCWVLWELMVLAQPLMVMAPSPGLLLAQSGAQCLTGCLAGPSSSAPERAMLP